MPNTSPTAEPASIAPAVAAAAPAPVGRGTIVLLMTAIFGGSVATIVPMAFTLALRLDQLAPGGEELLGYVLAANAISQLIATPLTGILSDRTRTRWGRRRPYTVGGLVLGIASVPIMIYATTVPALAAGWVLTSLGFGTALGSVGSFQADRLPQHQRGKVSGLAGMTMQTAPVAGVLLAGAVSQDQVLVFLLPALAGVLGLLAFVVFIPEMDSRHLRPPSPLSTGALLRSFGFNPRRFPDFAWNWLGRFIFFIGISFTTSYTSFFYAQRLGLPVAQVVTVVATVSGLSVLGAMGGSMTGGWLSDRFQRRRPFIFLGAAVYAAAAVVLALSWGMPMLLVGGFLNTCGIAMFSAVNQAMVLDILPDRENQAGRFMAITTFSQKIPSALGPVAAPLILAAGQQANYTSLYLSAAGLALAGGLLIATKVRGVR
ncbi:MFS transporter [Arthrobacter sp. NQ7]|uniref:MFS transporter n=1 Tax=Arthrobacter sp. NQ7 TaxID=3032303 RepID=UPI00240F35EF|nr:MFS transporter [Arthrobacter sp. NQ7]MDJ0458629.1 MFS transporter [Arthrobacter sp. NQ7]